MPRAQAAQRDHKGACEGLREGQGQSAGHGHSWLRRRRKGHGIGMQVACTHGRGRKRVFPCRFQKGSAQAAPRRPSDPVSDFRRPEL